MSKRKVNEFRLEVGRAVIGIICPNKEYAKSFSTYFGVANSKKEPDITLNLNLIYHEDDIAIPDSLFTTKTVANDIINIADGIVLGKIGPDPNHVQLSVKIGLTHTEVTRVFEQLLYQSFYSACRAASYDALLIHSAGVIYHDDGFIFTGPSGSGKSTIAALSKNHHVINDEICLLEFNNGNVMLQGTPYNGTFKDKKSGSAPLKAIFIIKHGSSHSISEIDKSKSVPMLAKEIVPPVPLQEEFKSIIFIRMLDMANLISRSVPVYMLEFLPDSGFWKEIDGFFQK
jgi:hypothetical protein